MSKHRMRCDRHSNVNTVASDPTDQHYWRSHAQDDLPSTNDALRHSFHSSYIAIWSLRVNFRVRHINRRQSIRERIGLSVLRTSIDGIDRPRNHSNLLVMIYFDGVHYRQAHRTWHPLANTLWYTNQPTLWRAHVVWTWNGITNRSIYWLFRISLRMKHFSYLDSRQYWMHCGLHVSNTNPNQLIVVAFRSQLLPTLWTVDNSNAEWFPVMVYVRDIDQ